MYSNNLKMLRYDNEYTQEDIANNLGVSRSTYKNWENGIVMIPIAVADKLSIFYKVKLSFIIGVDSEYKIYKDIKEMNYDNFIRSLNNLKMRNNNTFEEIGTFLDCDRSTCQRYFNNVVKMPIDRLVMLSKVYDFDIDEILEKI